MEPNPYNILSYIRYVHLSYINRCAYLIVYFSYIIVLLFFLHKVNYYYYSNIYIYYIICMYSVYSIHTYARKGACGRWMVRRVDDVSWSWSEMSIKKTHVDRGRAIYTSYTRWNSIYILWYKHTSMHDTTTCILFVVVINGRMDFSLW